MKINFKTSFFHRNKKKLNQGLILIKMRESKKKQQYFKLIIKENIMYK